MNNVEIWGIWMPSLIRRKKIVRREGWGFKEKDTPIWGFSKEELQEKILFPGELRIMSDEDVARFPKIAEAVVNMLRMQKADVELTHAKMGDWGKRCEC